MSKRFVLILVLALAATTLAPPIFAQDSDDASVLQDQLAQDAATKIAAVYSLTKTGFGSADRVIDPGTIYTFRIEGLLSRTVLDHMTPTNVIDVDGKLLPPAKGFIASFGASGDVQQINPGDRYYLHAVEGNKDSITFTFLSVNTSPIVYKGSSSRSRLRMYLKFALPKDDKKKTTFPAPADFHKLTDAVFYPADAVDMRPTLEAGQTEEEVHKVLGQPETAVRFGNKTILAFKNVKVILTDGKVTDVN